MAEVVPGSGNKRQTGRLLLPEGSAVLTTPGEIDALLEECAQRKSPAMLVFFETSFVCQARFEDASKGSIALEILTDAEERVLSQSLRVLSPCSVIFHHQLTRTFVSSVIRHRKVTQHEPHKVFLARPRLVTGADARLAFRVPVVSDAPVVIVATTGDGIRLTPRLIDISSTGVLIELDEPKPELSPTDELQVTIELGGTRTTMRAVVRREHGARYGLHFPDSMRDGEPEPTPELRSIMSELERLWLRARNR